MQIIDPYQINYLLNSNKKVNSSKMRIYLLLFLPSVGLLAQPRILEVPLNPAHNSSFPIGIEFGVLLPYLSKGNSLCISSAPSHLSTSNAYTSVIIRRRKEQIKNTVSFSLSAGYMFTDDFSLGLRTKYIPCIRENHSMIFDQKVSTTVPDLNINSFGTFEQEVSGKATLLMAYGNYTFPVKRVRCGNLIKVSFQADVGVSTMNLHASVPYLFFYAQTNSANFNSYTSLNGEVKPESNNFTSFTWQISSTADLHLNRNILFQLGIGFGSIGKFKLFQRTPEFTSIIQLTTQALPAIEEYSLHLKTNNLKRSLFATEIFLRYNLSRLWD